MLKYIISLAGLTVAFIIVKSILCSKRRKELMKKPFPKEWDEILQEKLSIYKRLPDDVKAQLQGLTQIFIDEKKFEGCDGVDVTDEMRVVIAAQACILLLNRKTDLYKKLNTVLVYPHPFVSQLDLKDNPKSKVKCAGLSWTEGVVALAWDRVRSGATSAQDGFNVSFHEFAHQLDQEDGIMDGTPAFKERSSFAPWAKYCSKAYKKLKKGGKNAVKSVLSTYGATNPAEFFAVASEAFFEKPKHMQKKLPNLYNEFKDYYNLDPAEWFE